MKRAMLPLFLTVVFSVMGYIYYPISVQASSYIYVRNPSSEDAIYRYDIESSPAIGEAFVDGGLSTATGLEFGPDGNLYVADIGSDSIRRYEGPLSAHPGNFMGTYVNNIDYPEAFTFGPDGNLYVNAHYEHKVYRFYGPESPYAGGPIGSGIFVSQAGQHPYDIIFGPDDNLYVSSIGKVMRFYGPSSPNAGQLIGTENFITEIYWAYGMAFGSDGNLYVADFTGDTIMRFYGPDGGPSGENPGDPIGDGVFINNIGDGPVGIAFGPDGNLYISCYYDHSIKRYYGLAGGPSGEAPGSPIDGGTFVSGLFYPLLITFDPFELDEASSVPEPMTVIMFSLFLIPLLKRMIGK